MTPKSQRRASLLASALLLTACGHSAPTRFFTLDPIAPARGAARPAYGGPPLRVRAVHIPPALDREELAHETDSGEMTIDDFAHWAAPLGDTARRALTQDLAARLPQGAVVAPEQPLPEGGCDLSIDILAFNVADGLASMQVSWSLKSPEGPGLPGRLIQLEGPASGPSSAAIAEGFSRLLGQLSDRILAGPISSGLPSGPALAAPCSDVKRRPTPQA